MTASTKAAGQFSKECRAGASPTERTAAHARASHHAAGSPRVPDGIADCVAGARLHQHGRRDVRAVPRTSLHNSQRDTSTLLVLFPQSCTESGMSGLMLLRSMIQSHRTFTASQSCLHDITAQLCQQLRSHPDKDRHIAAKHARPVYAGPVEIYCTFTDGDCALLAQHAGAFCTWTEIVWLRPDMLNQSAQGLEMSFAPL